MLTWLVALLAIVAAAMKGALVAFTRRACGEALVRTAARLYSTEPVLREVRREEWLRHLEDIAPAERPQFAGEVLWAGVRRGAIERSRRLVASGTSPSEIARRAVTTSLAALGAVALPMALAAITAGSPTSPPGAAASASSHASFLEGQLDLVQARAQAEDVRFQLQAPPAEPVLIVVPESVTPIP